MNDQNTINFPELQNAMLDSVTLKLFFEELKEYAQILSILPKWADRRMVAEDNMALPEASSLLLNGQIRGLQIRYKYQDEEWWDTLMPVEGSYRLVRVKQQFQE